MSESNSSTDTFSEPCFSLTLAVRAVLRANGYDADIDDLHAALGLSFLAVAAPDECDVASWASRARDAFLVEAAALFGLDVRPVHPPEAARGLEEAREFTQHFDASYRPIVVRALEHGQPVLAWRGWPEDVGPCWGMITEESSGGIGFSGIPMASRDPERAGHATLVRPPVQLYVVESIRAAAPPGGELLAAAMDFTGRELRGALDDRFGVATGIRAYDAWKSRVSREAESRGDESFNWESHQQLAGCIAAGHESGLGFLKRCRRDAVPGLPVDIDSLIAGAAGVVAAMHGITERPREADLGRGDLLDAIASARRGTCEMTAAFH